MLRKEVKLCINSHLVSLLYRISYFQHKLWKSLCIPMGELKFRIQPKLEMLVLGYVKLFKDLQLKPLITVAQGHQCTSFPFIK